MRIYSSIDELTGNTPLVELRRIAEKYNLQARIIAKVESFNPAGSVKDRVAKNMIDDAFARGLINNNSVIIEPTSGNTGIGLAAVCAARGIRLIIVMPETMSMERRLLMKAYGAELVLSDGSTGMKGAIAKAEEIAATTPNSFIAGQFVNPANPQAHKMTTAPEIFRDTDGEIDVFIAGVGTGGTVTGVGEYLKSVKPQVRIIAVEPEGSAVMSGGSSGAHKLQGIGAGFIPSILNTDIYDEIMTVSDDDAMKFGRELGRTEGILAGISSGAAVAAAVSYAMRKESVGQNIVVLLPDTGERYLSTELFAD